jgi:hypothetical protein
VFPHPLCGSAADATDVDVDDGVDDDDDDDDDDRTARGRWTVSIGNKVVTLSLTSIVVIVGNRIGRTSVDAES